MKSTLQILTDARALLAKGRWTKGAMAKTIWGHRVDWADERAHSFCMIGAVVKCGGTTFDGAYDVLLKVCNGSVSLFNDTAKTLPEVLAAFDRAIATTQETQ